jgi:hypothetical protein
VHVLAPYQGKSMSLSQRARLVVEGEL